MAPFRILAMDGGGIRGIYTAVLLRRLEETVPGFLDSVDCFAGTSTGSILALGLAHGLTPAAAIDLYRRCGPAVFADSWLDDIGDLFGLIGADYDTQPLKEILTGVFGRQTLGGLRQATGKRVLVPTFDLDASRNGERNWKPKFFHNFPGEEPDDGQLAVDVIVRSTAAPTYFPTYQGYIDGGVVAGNPAMAAVAQALDGRNDQPQALSDLRLLSLGTGRTTRFIAGDKDWGLLQWARPLISLILEGTSGVADFQCRQLLGADQYHRLAPVLPRPIALDAVDEIEALVALAEAVRLEDGEGVKTIDWLEACFGD